MTVTGTGSVTRSATLTLTVTGTGGCAATQVIGNGGFESGATAWTASSGVITNSSSKPARTGSYKAWLNGYGSTRTETLSQSVTVPAGCASYTLSFWTRIDTAETTTSTAYDKLTVRMGSTTLATYSNLNASTSYVQRTLQRCRVRRADGDADVHRHRGLVVADQLRDRRRDVAGELTAYPQKRAAAGVPGGGPSRRGSGELRVERGDAAGQPGLHLAAEVVGDDLVRVGLDAVHRRSGRSSPGPTSGR